MTTRILLISTALCFLSCNDAEKKQDLLLKEGPWRAELQVSDSEVLPFNFEVLSNGQLEIYNADEVIFVKDVSYENDSVLIQTPVFAGYIKAAVGDSTLNGNYIKEDLDRVVPFRASYGKSDRFVATSKDAAQNVSGNWEAVFSQDTDDAYIAKGIFEQDGQKVTGTFRTTTGDYRYLEGVVEGNQMKLSTFDGAHAFLFTAEVEDSLMNGTFYSGNHWQEPFTAKRNDDFELPKADSLTFLKEGYDKIEFSFPDSEGNTVSLSDSRFQDKVVLVQIMGTWCPNCLDESTFFSEYYKKQKDKDLEIVALAFEYAKTEENAFKNIERLKNDVGIEYPILLAQVGTSSKAKANEKLPMLNHVLCYPTTIFIDRAGKVRKIHTGFNGPATGEKFTEFKKEFDAFVKQLLAETTEELNEKL